MLLAALRSIATSRFSYFGGWNLLYLSAFILYNCYQLWALGRRGAAEQHPGYDRQESRRPDAAAAAATLHGQAPFAAGSGRCVGGAR